MLSLKFSFLTFGSRFPGRPAVPDPSRPPARRGEARMAQHGKGHQHSPQHQPSVLEAQQGAAGRALQAL